MDDIKHLMKDHFLKYASYVILDRAIPSVIDGLKPVQRRILHMLWLMHDGKLHKVANVAGQTMALHPHGDGPITEALVNLANKSYLLDMQGNFGNTLTGDPPAASRYIETRLSPLALATMFNADLTSMSPSYDGRHQEPVHLPAKIPLLLLQGAEGIAVGMATNILPHNFNELLEAQIAILEGRDYSILPDFPTGGLVDAGNYNKGKGKVKLRVKIEIQDTKTVVIKEICYGTTTESLIRSIDEAAKKGKIKIESINDYTSDKVNIELKLPRGHYAEDLIETLYAYTECEVTLSPQMITIKDDLPWEGDVHEILELHTTHLHGYLKRELEIESERLLEKIFEKTLEQIFIENRLYKRIEEINDYEKIHGTIATALEPFHKLLIRVPTENDRERLLSIPIRRISRFDIEKNHNEIAAAKSEQAKVESHLKNIKKFTVNYLKGLLVKYGKEYPRRTQIHTIEQLDMRAIEKRTIKVGFDLATGFVGTKVTDAESFECTNFDKVLVMYTNGTYKVSNISEKQYVGHKDSKIAYIGPADKKTLLQVIYRDPATDQAYAKSFIIDKFILDKEYRFIPEGTDLKIITAQPQAQVEILFLPTPRLPNAKMTFNFSTILTKGVSAKGIRINPKAVKKITLLQPPKRES